ncbi:MAG: Fur family transcriptional regulator [Firmicutes bacterium]|nr:Fur family transcriptional regulator [Bacillota bacterium]
MSLEEIEAVLNNYLNKEKRRVTKQRKLILHVFANSKAHVTIEELHNKVRQHQSNVGVATVYRTVKLLYECGLATGFRDSDGTFRYELEQECHHHLICIKCGKLIEDTDLQMMVHQNQLAAKQHFRVLHSRVELYGICCECLAKRN